MMRQKASNTTKKFTLIAILVSIILLFSFTPFGYINLGLIKATLIQIPVILGSVILGPRIGALLGGIFGFTSLLINTLSPSILSFAFSPFIPVLGTQNGSPWALIICFIPRILVGIIPYYVFTMLTKTTLSLRLNLIITGFFGSMLNTILVMNLIYFVFKNQYAVARGISVSSSVYQAILVVIGVNGIPEAIVTAIVISIITPILIKRLNIMT